jgi:hypothetical protein
VPIELISYEGAGITIGDHTFINYGSSPETFLLIVWRRAIRLASSATSNLATLVHRRSSLPVPLAPLVREWGCRVGGSRPEGRYQAAGIGGRASIPPEVLEPVRRQRCVDTNTGDKSRARSDDNVGIMQRSKFRCCAHNIADILNPNRRSGVNVILGASQGGCRYDCASGLFAWIDRGVDTERYLLGLYSGTGGGPTK